MSDRLRRKSKRRRKASSSQLKKAPRSSTWESLARPRGNPRSPSRLRRSRTRRRRRKSDNAIDKAIFMISQARSYFGG